MARPTAQSLNRSPGLSSSRATAAPSVQVQAPLNVNVGPNSLQGLAEILGVGTNIAMTEAAKDRQRREREREERETMIATAEAEAAVRNGTIDADRMRDDWTYAKRVRTYRGTRVGVELRQQFEADAEAFRRDNPLADEHEVRAWMAEWRQSRVYDENGQPLYDMDDPIQDALVQSQLDEAGYRFLEGDRDVLRENLRRVGSEEVGSLFLAGIEESGTVTAQDYQNLYVGFRQVGNDHDQANELVRQWAGAAAEKLENPEVIRALPREWQDGSDTPWADPEAAAALDNQIDFYTARQRTAAIEALAPERTNMQILMEDNADQGIEPTAEQIQAWRDAGGSESTLVTIITGARAKQRDLIEEARREAEEAEERAAEVQAFRDNPLSVSRAKQASLLEDMLAEAETPEAREAVIRWGARNADNLPTSHRNYLNRTPTSPDALPAWAGAMARLRSYNDQTFLSLNEYARNQFEAYEALRAAGRFNDAQLWQQLQTRDEEAGNRLLRSDEAAALRDDLLGDNYTPTDLRNLNRIISAFGSYTELPRQEALELAQRSFERQYFSQDGITYNRSEIRDPEILDWAKGYFARRSAQSGGVRYDPDDLVITSLGNGQYSVRERGANGSIIARSFSGEELLRQYREDEREEVIRKYGAAAVGAAEKFLAGDKSMRPDRHITGESATAPLGSGNNRGERMKLEQQAAQALRAIDRRITGRK